MLDCSGLGWEGLKNYSGTFDFGGCVVKNASCPMFLSVKNGTVKNLTVAESKYDYNDMDSERDEPIVSGQSARIYYAPVVSYLNGGVVDNIVIESTVKINTNIYAKNCGIGGVVGWAKGTNMTISNCTFKGEFYTDSGAGLVGIARSKEAFINCYNYNSGAAVAIRNANDKNVNLGASPTNVESLTVTNCQAFSDLAKLFDAVSAACPNVYSYDAQTKNFTISSAKVAG